MKNRDFKRFLEQELPYPRLTVKADQRMDAILSALPDKAMAIGFERGQGDIPLLNGEKDVYVEARNRRPVLAVFKWAAVCALVLVLGLCCLNWASPAVTENLPVIGGVFRAANSWFGGGETIGREPQPSVLETASAVLTATDFQDLPIEDNETGLPTDGTTLISAEVVSDDGIPQQWSLVCTAKLPYLGAESWNLLEYDPNDWRPNGTEAILHFPDGMFTYSGRSSIDGDKGDAPTVTWEFGIDPKYLDGPAVLSIPERNWFAENEDGSVDRRIIAEFTIDLSSRKNANTASVKAAVTDYYKTGYFGGQAIQKVTPAQALEAPRNGEFTNGWYAQKPVIVPADQRRDGGSESGYKVTFFQQDIVTEGLGPDTGVYRHPEWDSVTLNYYVDEQFVGSVPVCSRTELDKSGVEYSVRDGTFGNEDVGNAKVYHTVGGDFLDVLADRELAGGDYRRLSFFIPTSALGMEDNEDFQLERYHSVRFELTDSGSSVIFADAAGAAEAEREQMADAYHTICTMAPMGSYNCEPDPSTHHPEEHLSFENHFSLQDLGGNDPNVLQPTPNLDASQYSCAITFYTDIREDLDWALKFTAAGEDYEIPLYPSDTAIRPPESKFDGSSEFDKLWTVIGSNSDYLVAWRSPDAEEAAKYGSELKRCYQVTLHPDSENFQGFYGCTWKIVNRQTQEVIYDSAAHCTSAATHRPDENRDTGSSYYTSDRSMAAPDPDADTPVNGATPTPSAMCAGYPTPDPSRYDTTPGVSSVSGPAS